MPNERGVLITRGGGGISENLTNGVVNFRGAGKIGIF